MSDKATATKKVVSIERKTAFDWEGLKAKVEKDHWRKFRIKLHTVTAVSRCDWLILPESIRPAATSEPCSS